MSCRGPVEKRREMYVYFFGALTNRFDYIIVSVDTVVWSDVTILVKLRLPCVIFDHFLPQPFASQSPMDMPRRGSMLRRVLTVSRSHNIRNHENRIRRAVSSAVVMVMKTPPSLNRVVNVINVPTIRALVRFASPLRVRLGSGGLPHHLQFPTRLTSDSPFASLLRRTSFGMHLLVLVGLPCLGVS